MVCEKTQFSPKAACRWMGCGVHTRILFAEICIVAGAVVPEARNGTRVACMHGVA